MESSGIFTDAENRDDNRQVDNDMSPDGSTDTLQSNGTECNSQKRPSTSQSPTSPSQPSQVMPVCEEKPPEAVEAVSVESRGVSGSDMGDKRSVKKVTPNRKHIKSEVGKCREIRRANTIASRSPSDMENQENKVPKKLKPPNKWDGVMNKIAEGKTSGKTKLNINEVKSKVFCGIARGATKISATSTEHNSPKRPTIVAKRGRTYSKDSQQSSQSDLSVSGGGCSPKLQPKTPILSRTAKKRDVRTITASPSDLGPPNKTTGTNVRNTRVNNVPPKRSPTLVAQQSLPATVPDATKGSPPAKRMVQRRQQISLQPQPKQPLKDHNRLAGVVPLATKAPAGAVNQQKVAPGRQQPTKNGPIGGPITENGFPGSHPAQVSAKISKTNGILPERVSQCHDLTHANRGFEALGVVIQYLVHSLDAFSMPTLKLNHERTTRKLLETRIALDETRTMCQELQVRLTEQEVREVQLRDEHHSEKQQMESHLMDVETRFRSYVTESEERRGVHEVQLKDAKTREMDLVQRINELSLRENELRDKVVASEEEFGEKLRLGAMRERDLQEKTQQLQRQLDETKVHADTRERELQERVDLLQDEITVLRHTRAAGTPQRQRTTSTQVLQDEVESLRCVLELKQSEISELRKHNQELQRSSDELSATMIKLSGTESRVEDLQVQLESRVNEEKDLLARNKMLQESYAREVKNCSRLVLHNEELQWKLKHNSEKFSRTLTELSKSYHEASSCSSRGKDASRANGDQQRLLECFEMEDVTPPTSPVMKGIVEKSDSVSWVLEMEDESAEALASRVVRRAGSFRASSQDKATKRTKCHGNALSQSASAASILHQQQPDTPRIRSQSVSHRASSGRNLARSNSVQTPTSSSRIEWREPAFTSSPLPGKVSPPKDSGPKKKRSNLITCDTSALTPRTERARLQLPKHSSVHDLQNLHPKESAGEAMVSGSNSEDEASSVDSSSAVSSSEECSSNSASPTNRRLRLGDFMMQKIVASLGAAAEGSTPMEVAWQEDGEQYATESIV
uniref:Putative microtubule-associated tumor suppressor 1 n=1 Tax=Nyssomyia neivai TaxID=330878 RepID=A0A1L8E4U4_9DIPT